MEIGIIGTGSMGKALARQWAARGHQMFLGSRSPDKGRRIASELGGDVEGGSIAEAAERGAIVVVAVPWLGVPAALQSARAGLHGKVLIDCTNPMVGARKPLLVGCTTSGAEEVAAMVTEARVVKAFNAIAARVLASGDPNFGGHTVTIFHCADDARANATVAGLIAELGYAPFDVGPLCVARYLEPLAALSLRLEETAGHDFDLVLTPLMRPRRKARTAE